MDGKWCFERISSIVGENGKKGWIKCMQQRAKQTSGGFRLMGQGKTKDDELQLAP